MFTSFDENKFWQAINDKDMSRLKINTVSAIRNDPTFSRSETKQVLDILDEKIPEIFEDEIDLGYEERLEKNEWNKDYFTKLTYWFQKNFAKSRLEHIKEVGQVVHKDNQQKYNRAPISQTGTRGSTNRTVNPLTASGKSKKWPLLVGGIAAATTLVLIVVLLIKFLTK